MNRTEGLVRRNKSRAAENGTSEANSSAANSVDENDVIIAERDNEIDDTDSKETRLTLMEEVLLLGLKDKEVNIAFFLFFFFFSSLVSLSLEERRWVLWNDFSCKEKVKRKEKTATMAIVMVSRARQISTFSVLWATPKISTKVAWTGSVNID